MARLTFIIVSCMVCRLVNFLCHCSISICSLSFIRPLWSSLLNSVGITDGSIHTPWSIVGLHATIASSTRINNGIKFGLNVPQNKTQNRTQNKTQNKTPTCLNFNYKRRSRAPQYVYPYKAGTRLSLVIMSIACHNLKSGILVTNKFVSCLPHVLSAGLGCQAEEQQQYNDDESH